VDLPAKQIKGRSDQPKYAGKDEGGANGFAGWKANDQQKNRHSETPAADPSESNGEGNDEPKEEVDHCARSENV